MTVNGINMTADEGKTFRRIEDQFIMGNGICLGINPLTGEQDVPENYEEIDDPDASTNSVSE